MTISIVFLFFGANIQIVESGKTNIDCDCTIYVDDDNTQGPWEGTENYPYKTIQEAINRAIVGDTICVKEGIYTEFLEIKGHSKDGITLCGENRDLTIIDAENKDMHDTILLENGYAFSLFF